jgi:RimJ/RimL family protein N-acetyltransferase
MNIHGDSIVIRAIEFEDLPALHLWSNDPEIWYNLGGWHFPSSQEELQQWLTTLPQDKLNQRWVVCTQEHGPIGYANLVSLDWKNRSAFHGLYIGDPVMRGKGHARDAVLSLMRYAFDELGLRRLDTDIIEYNERSLAFYTKKCGWRVEGEKADAYYRKGRWWNKYLLGITEADYREFLKNA